MSVFARLIAPIAAVACGAGACRPPAPTAVAGVLDLQLELRRDGIADLAGEWDFVWGSFEDPRGNRAAGPASGSIRVPAPWNGAILPGKPAGADGYGTYRLRVECIESARLALVMPVQHSATRFYVNGVVLAQQGTPGVSPEQARPAFAQQVAPMGEAVCPLDIVAHVSNFDMRNGGLLRSIELGTERQLIERRERGLSRDLFALGGIFVLSLLPVLVFFWRREDRAPLWLGLYGLGSATFIGLRAPVPTIARSAGRRWKIVLLHLTVAFFPAFLRSLTQAFPRPLFGPSWRRRALAVRARRAYARSPGDPDPLPAPPPAVSAVAALARRAAGREGGRSSPVPRF